MLVLATGCSKRAADDATDAKLTSLAGKPKTLFFLFGDKADPRILPLATLANGQIKPIVLDSSGWRNFDHLYFASGTHLPLYSGGKQIGDAVIRRGMWDGSEALYKLPNCRSPRPLAAATLDSSAVSAVMVELLATSDALPVAPPRPAPLPAETDSARALTIRVAQHEGLTSTARGELDEVLNTFATGATPHATVTGSYLERGSGVTGKPRHVFVIGDLVDSTKGYVQTFVHVPSDSTREFRRLIDHVDLTGDGVDEIVLEGWRNGSDSFLVFLQYKDGHWREIARGATSWCDDRKRS